MAFCCDCFDDATDPVKTGQQQAPGQQKPPGAPVPPGAAPPPGTVQPPGTMPPRQQAPLQRGTSGGGLPSEGELVPEFSAAPQGLEGQDLVATSNVSMRTRDYSANIDLGASSSCRKKSSMDDAIRRHPVPEAPPPGKRESKESKKSDMDGADKENAGKHLEKAESTTEKTSESSSKHEHHVKRHKRDSAPCCCPMYEVEMVRAPAKGGGVRHGPSDRLGMQVVATETVTQRKYTYNMDVDLPEGVRVSPRGKLVEDQGVSAEQDVYDGYAPFIAKPAYAQAYAPPPPAYALPQQPQLVGPRQLAPYQPRQAAPPGQPYQRPQAFGALPQQIQAARYEPQPAPQQLQAARYEPQPAPQQLQAARYEPQPAPQQLQAARYEPQPVPQQLQAARYEPQPAPQQLQAARYEPQPAPQQLQAARYEPQPAPQQFQVNAYEPLRQLQRVQIIQGVGGAGPKKKDSLVFQCLCEHDKTATTTTTSSTTRSKSKTTSTKASSGDSKKNSAGSKNGKKRSKDSSKSNRGDKKHSREKRGSSSSSSRGSSSSTTTHGSAKNKKAGAHDGFVQVQIHCDKCRLRKSYLVCKACYSRHKLTTCKDCKTPTVREYVRYASSNALLNAAGQVAYHPDMPQQQPLYEQQRYGQGVYRPQQYEQAGYQNQQYEQAGYQNQQYEQAGHQNQQYEQAGYQNQQYEQAGYQNQQYEQAGYQNQQFEARLPPPFPGNRQPALIVTCRSRTMVQRSDTDLAGGQYYGDPYAQAVTTNILLGVDMLPCHEAEDSNGTTTTTTVTTTASSTSTDQAHSPKSGTRSPTKTGTRSGNKSPSRNGNKSPSKGSAKSNRNLAPAKSRTAVEDRGSSLCKCGHDSRVCKVCCAVKPER